MIDVIVYKLVGSCLYMINPSGFVLKLFIIYHIKHERVYVSYRTQHARVLQYNYIIRDFILLIVIKSLYIFLSHKFIIINLD